MFFLTGTLVGLSRTSEESGSNILFSSGVVDVAKLFQSGGTCTAWVKYFGQLLRCQMRKKHTTIGPFRSVLGVVLAIIVGCLGCSGDKTTGLKPEQHVFFPSPPEIPRVQFLHNFHSSEDFASKRSGLAEFIAGEEIDKYKTISKPYGIAVSGGKVFVADTTSASIAVIDFAEQSFETFGQTGPGALRKPINVRFGPSGKLYVADTLRNQIVVFDTDGNYITEYGTGKEFKPADVVVTEEELFVLDIASHSIHVYDLQTHQLKRSFGKRGKGFGEFNYPTNMVMDAQEFINVCDSMNLRVQRIDRNGKTSFLFGKPGVTPGHFSRPRGIAVDRDGITYIADARLGIVQLFDPEGKALMYLGGTGTEDGQLYLPAQVVISYDIAEPFRKYIAPNFEPEYLVFVTNQLGPNKVSIFAFGKGPASAEIQPATQSESATIQPATQPK